MTSFLIDGYDWQGTRLGRFVQRYGYESIESLQCESVENPEPFWEALVSEIDLTWLSPYAKVVETRRDGALPDWFCGGTLNVSIDAVDKWAARQPERAAIRWEGENGQAASLSCAALAREVGRVATGLAGLGVKKGDRVGLCLAMTPEAVVALLAAARLGAVAVPLALDQDAESMAARIRDCGASVLFCADGWLRGGRVFSVLERVRRAASRAGCVSTLLVVSRLARDGIDVPDEDAFGPASSEIRYDDLGYAGAAAIGAVPVAPSDAMLLLYADTTRSRLCSATHTQLGFYVKACQDLTASLDVHPGDTLLWMAPMHQVMGPMLVLAGLSLGLTLVLVEGLPDYPAKGRLWDLVASHRVTHLGLDPAWVQTHAGSDHGYPWYGRIDSVRVLGSSGAPWQELPWWWVFQTVGSGRRPVVSLSGGTGIHGGFVGSFPGFPLKPGAYSGPFPGVAAQVRDPRGRPLIGRPGQLVIHKPWPWMSRGPWMGSGSGVSPIQGPRPDPIRHPRSGVWRMDDRMMVDTEGFWFECHPEAHGVARVG